MSKRHQANRRKNYGRRQHEVRERRHRDLAPSDGEHELDDLGPTAAMPDRLAFLDPRTTAIGTGLTPALRLRFALGD